MSHTRIIGGFDSSKKYSGNWSKAEEKVFYDVIRNSGKHDFVRIASSVPNRTYDQVRSYYYSQIQYIKETMPDIDLNPEINQIVALILWWEFVLYNPSLPLEKHRKDIFTQAYKQAIIDLNAFSGNPRPVGPVLVSSSSDPVRIFSNITTNPMGVALSGMMEPKQVVTTTKRPIEEDNNNKSKKLKSDVVDIESDDKDTPNNNKNSKKNDLKANETLIESGDELRKSKQLSKVEVEDVESTDKEDETPKKASSPKPKKDKKKKGTNKKKKSNKSEDDDDSESDSADSSDAKSSKKKKEKSKEKSTKNKDKKKKNKNKKNDSESEESEDDKKKKTKKKQTKWQISVDFYSNTTDNKAQTFRMAVDTEKSFADVLENAAKRMSKKGQTVKPDQLSIFVKSGDKDKEAEIDSDDIIGDTLEFDERNNLIVKKIKQLNLNIYIHIIDLFICISQQKFVVIFDRS